MKLDPGLIDLFIFAVIPRGRGGGEMGPGREQRKA